MSQRPSAPPAGKVGVDAFDPAYGAAFGAEEASDLELSCELVEDGGVFLPHRATVHDRPYRLAFVDGTMRTEARLTLTGLGGEVSTGLAGSWAVGAVLVTAGTPARVERVTVGRATIVTNGQTVELPDQPGGWCWESYPVPHGDFLATRQHLQRLMRDEEMDLAEGLCHEGWLTVLDGPLHGIRHRRGLPIIGYVKTHHRRTLSPEHWTQVPKLSLGERSGLFAFGDDLFACYLRMGDPGPWASDWAGIARIEMPAGIGQGHAVETADRALGWLPDFATALHRDPRAPVNLTPIAGLERHLHHLQGDPHLALRAVREAVVQKNREEQV